MRFLLFTFFALLAANRLSAQSSKSVPVADTILTLKSRKANAAHRIPSKQRRGKAAACAATNVTFDNWTSLTIKVYLDGNFKGTIDPWGKFTVAVPDAWSTVYLLSTDGKREWSDTGFGCSANVTYKLQ